MNWTMIILAVGLTALGLALVLLAVYLRRGSDTAGETGQPGKGGDSAPAQPEPSANAFIDEPLETDMSAVLLGSAPFSATGTSPAVDLTVDREPLSPVPEEPQEELPPTWEPGTAEAPPAPAWKQAAPETVEPETIDVDIAPDELEMAPTSRALVPTRLGEGDYSWQLRRDAPILGAAAGIAVAASLIGYAVGRRRRKSG